MALGLEWYKWMGIIGCPSILAIVGHLIVLTRRLRILMKAQQADMRNQLLEDYDYYMLGGWISNAHMIEWENRYQAYHSLGQNGVLDAKRQDLLKLPNHPPV